MEITSTFPPPLTLVRGPGSPLPPPYPPSAPDSPPGVVEAGTDPKGQNDWSNVFLIMYLVFIGVLGVIICPLMLFYWWKVKNTCDRVRAGGKMLIFVRKGRRELLSTHYSGRENFKSSVNQAVTTTTGTNPASSSHEPAASEATASESVPGPKSGPGAGADSSVRTSDGNARLGPVHVTMGELCFFSFFHPNFVFIFLSILAAAGLITSIGIVGLLGMAVYCYEVKCSVNTNVTRGIWICIIVLLPIYGTPSLLLSYHLRQLWHYWQEGRRWFL